MLALRNHKKSKDVRQRFFAQAHRAYEENRKKAAAFTRGQGFRPLPTKSPQTTGCLARTMTEVRL